MQFHLNGFHPGDPHIAKASSGASAQNASAPAQVDVLIVGCALLRPLEGRYGLCDHEKVFSADLKGKLDIFDLRGIDRLRGALVVVRPDQYVAHVLPLGAHQELARFFAPCMLEQ